MATYIATAFSFLAANLGWFGGMSQTETFFWTCLVLEAVLSVILVLVLLVWGGSDGGGAVGVLVGGGVSLVAVVLIVVNFLLCMLLAWIATQLWTSLDFFLAFQVFAIGSATGKLFSSKKSD